MSKLSRVGWGALAALFLVTFLAGVILTVVQITRSSSQQNTTGLPCTQASKVPNQQPGKNGKIKGAQLADFNPPQKVSSIQCIDYKVGSGTTAQQSSLVSVNYVGALASSGTIFDDSFDTGQAFTTTLNQVIPGWTLGIPGMKVGGIRRLFIPSALGYGTTGQGTIPPNADLVFDVQLVNVK